MKQPLEKTLDDEAVARVLRAARMGLAMPCTSAEKKGRRAGSDWQLRRTIQQASQILRDRGRDDLLHAAMGDDARIGRPYQPAVNTDSDGGHCSEPGCRLETYLNGRCRMHHLKHRHELQVELDDQAGQAVTDDVDRRRRIPARLRFNGGRPENRIPPETPTPATPPTLSTPTEPTHAEAPAPAEDPTERISTMAQTKTTCAVPECGRPIKTRGLCGMHYKRLQKGDSALGKYAAEPNPDRWRKEKRAGAAAERPVTRPASTVLAEPDEKAAARFNAAFIRKLFEALGIEATLVDLQTPSGRAIYNEQTGRLVVLEASGAVTSGRLAIVP